jgi:hypothetical protein
MNMPESEAIWENASLSGRFFHPSIREVKDANIRRGLLSGTLKLLQLLSLHSPFSKQRRKPIQ